MFWVFCKSENHLFWSFPKFPACKYTTLHFSTTNDIVVLFKRVIPPHFRRKLSYSSLEASQFPAKIFISLTIYQPWTLSADLPAARRGLFTNLPSKASNSAKQCTNLFRRHWRQMIDSCPWIDFWRKMVYDCPIKKRASLNWKCTSSGIKHECFYP